MRIGMRGLACLTIFAASAACYATAAPDQVLVLYNKDWSEDLDGTAPGQDSEEVARYYVDRHTDPATGKKPYLLGLTCVHGKHHLDEFRMQEDKGDNERGVAFKGKGTLPDGLIIPCSFASFSPSGGEMVEKDKDSVPLEIPNEARKSIDPKRVVIRLGPSDDLETNPVVYEGGKCVKEEWFSEKDGYWTIKLAAFAGGKNKLWFKGADSKGEAVVIRAAVYGPVEKPAEGKPVGAFQVFGGIYPRITVSKEECADFDAASVRITMGTEDDPAKARQVWPVAADVTEQPLVIPAAGGRDFLLRASAFSKGTVYAWLTVKGADGKEFAKKAAFFDPSDFEASLLGPDGIPDDKFYQEDIAQPVKKFLEDPANKLPDGTLLKDHILYIVVCYGLPLQVKSAYGIRRGTLSGTVNDAGTGSALEQRLAMLYYDDAKFAKPIVIPQNPAAGPMIPTVATHFRATLTGGTIAGGVSPYRHPWAHDDIHGRPSILPAEMEHPHFTQDYRKKFGDRFIYLAMRVDDVDPELAKAEVDYSLYGASYMTTKMPGCVKWGTWREGERGKRELANLGFDTSVPRLGDERRVLWFFGFFGYGNRVIEQEFMPDVVVVENGKERKTNPRQPTFGEKPMMPGGLGYAVRSGEQWRARVRSQFGFYQDKALEAGITVGGGDALGAHITSHSWWDDQVFFHHFFRGWDAAECMYMSSLYMSWITYFVGDPLYAPDLSKTRVDLEPPVVKPGKAGLVDVKFGEGKSGAWARIGVELLQRPGIPEVAEMRVECRPIDAPAKKTAGSNWRYLSKTSACVGGLEAGKTYSYVVTLTDPYGNATPVPGAFTVPEKLAKAKPLGEVVPGSDDKTFLDRAAKLLDQADPERGEIRLTYAVDKESDSALYVLKGGKLSFQGNGMKGLSFEVGGAPVASNMVLFNKAKQPDWKLDQFQTKKGDEVRVILRWSREPLMREIALVAKDGSEWLLGANNFIPWHPASAEATAGKPGGPSPAKAPSGITLAPPDQSGVRVTRIELYDRADPPPVEHSAVYPHAFDMDAFAKASK